MQIVLEFFCTKLLTNRQRNNDDYISSLAEVNTINITVMQLKQSNNTKGCSLYKNGTDTVFLSLMLYNIVQYLKMLWYHNCRSKNNDRHTPKQSGGLPEKAKAHLAGHPKARQQQ